MMMQTSDDAGAIVRTAVMPAPALPVSVQALQSLTNAPQVEVAVSRADRALGHR